MDKGLFRAKSIEEDSLDEWVYGYYVCLNNKEHRIYTGFAIMDYGDYYPEWFKVDPNTVSRFVNKIDIKGNRIYSGDIVAVYKRNYPDDVSFNTATVVDEHTITVNGYGKWMPQDTVLLEVIGNIFENLECCGFDMRENCNSKKDCNNCALYYEKQHHEKCNICVITKDSEEPSEWVEGPYEVDE